jgi:hypothetical protein
MAALVGPVQNTFFLTVHNSFDPVTVTQQAGPLVFLYVYLVTSNQIYGLNVNWHGGGGGLKWYCDEKLKG